MIKDFAFLRQIKIKTVFQMQIQQKRLSCFVSLTTTITTATTLATAITTTAVSKLTETSIQSTIARTTRHYCLL